MSNSVLIGNYLDQIIPDPKCELDFDTDYGLLIAVVLSSQTTDKRVNVVTKKLFTMYPDLYSLKDASKDDLEDILRPLGSFRKKASYVSMIANILVNEYDLKVPTDINLLEKLPGVGHKTASVFLSEFYNYPAFAVDTHVSRVSKRLGLSKESDGVTEIERKLKKKFKKKEWSKRHKQMVLFGRYYCKALRPLCEDCLFRDMCIKKN